MAGTKTPWLSDPLKVEDIQGCVPRNVLIDYTAARTSDHTTQLNKSINLINSSVLRYLQPRPGTLSMNSIPILTPFTAKLWINHRSFLCHFP
jgi:hypothetical protein